VFSAAEIDGFEARALDLAQYEIEEWIGGHAPRRVEKTWGTSPTSSVGELKSTPAALPFPQQDLKIARAAERCKPGADPLGTRCRCIPHATPLPAVPQTVSSEVRRVQRSHGGESWARTASRLVRAPACRRHYPCASGRATRAEHLRPARPGRSAAQLPYGMDPVRHRRDVVELMESSNEGQIPTSSPYVTDGCSARRSPSTGALNAAADL
jgi:hypothetical protein